MLWPVAHRFSTNTRGSCSSAREFHSGILPRSSAVEPRRLIVSRFPTKTLDAATRQARGSLFSDHPISRSPDPPIFHRHLDFPFLRKARRLFVPCIHVPGHADARIVGEHALDA